MALAEEAVALAEEDLRVARALVEAGKEAELRAYQAQAAVTAARAALDTARADRTEALARLTALAGSSTPFTALSGSLLTRMWTKPSVTTIGIDAPTIATSSNTLVPTAAAKVSMRIAPDEDPQTAYEALKAFRNEEYLWFQVADGTFDNFMFAQQQKGAL